MTALAITGLGAISPLGPDPESFFAALLAGKSAAAPAHDFVPPLPKPYVLARVRDFDASLYVTAMKARRMDRCSLFTLAAAKQALAGAGWPPENNDELGIVLGTNTGGAGPLTEFLKVLLTDSPEAASPLHFPNTVANAPASQTAIELKILGPNATLSHKEAAGLSALAYAELLLADHRARALLVGGSDECNPYYLYGYGQLRALAGSRSDGSGFIAGEGSYQVLVEPEPAARARGAAILARVHGVAERNFPVQPFEFRADAATAEAVLDDAFELAGCGAADIGYVLRSANGVAAVDAMETRLLAARLPGTPTLSYKNSIGEGSGSAIAGAIIAALAWRHGHWPGAKTLSPRHALILNFAAGGSYLAVVVEAP